MHFCYKQMNGGITRGKEHLMGKKGRLSHARSVRKVFVKNFGNILPTKELQDPLRFLCLVIQLDILILVATHQVFFAPSDATILMWLLLHETLGKLYELYFKREEAIILTRCPKYSSILFEFAIN